jgi:Transposase IS116/IS110/IS902 family
VPVVAPSGPVSRRGRRAKQGNPHLKRVYGQAALYLIRYDLKSRRAFDRQLARHRGKGRKLIVCDLMAHTLAQAVDRVHPDGTVYRKESLIRP